MARNSSSVIEALRNTALELGRSGDYQWGHMGSCNCGYLAQQITHLNKRQIHSYAMQRHGDWNEQLNDYCPTSGLPMDELISEMLNFGFDRDELKDLEQLSDKRILSSLPPDERNLHHNIKGDVIKYLNAWASLLEYDLAEFFPADLRRLRGTLIFADLFCVSPREVGLPNVRESISLSDPLAV